MHNKKAEITFTKLAQLYALSHPLQEHKLQLPQMII